MARRRLSDKLQDHYFWAFDATAEAGIPIFNPLFGFSRVSAPEIGLEIEQFKDGTFLYNRGVVKGGVASPVIFERAASMFDADFYDWIITTLHGNNEFKAGGTLGNFNISVDFGNGGRTTPRRNLLVIQFTSINLKETPLINDPVIAAAAATGGTIIAGALGTVLGGGVLGGLGAAGGAALLAGAIALGIGPFEFATRVPARGWLLHNCLPVRYRAGNDFDAQSGAISLMELEVQPEYIEEFSLGIKP